MKPDTPDSQSSDNPPELVPVATMAAQSPRLSVCYPEIADDENERLVYDVRKHWIGIVGIVTVAIIVLTIVIAAALALPTLTTANNATITPQIGSAIALFLLIIILFTVAGAGIALWVYTNSHLLITDQNVIEVRQNSLFSRQISHLNMINVEDVSVNRSGILQTFVNYGTLQIQTAGATDKFEYTYTPTPDVYRRFIIRAHEIAVEQAGDNPAIRENVR